MSDVIIRNLPFNAGQTLTIFATPTLNAATFHVNIYPNDEDIALHFNPRFKSYKGEQLVVLNSRKGGQWGEEHREKDFPFHHGQELKIVIEFTSTQFTVTISDYQFIFPNRLGGEQYSYFTVKGDIHLKSFEIQ